MKENPKKPQDEFEVKELVADISDEENWDKRLGFLIHDISRLRRIVVDEMMRPLGGTRSQWWVLAYLTHHNGLSQTELASVLDLGRAALGGLVDRLESSGFITRKADKHDRRINRIFLTAKGKHIAEEMYIKNKKLSEFMLNGLTKTERNILTRKLSLIKENLHKAKGSDLF